jgi:excisionase family DNA binding protein
MDNKAYTVEEFLMAYKVGRTKAYEEISSGRLRTYRVGRKRLISTPAADEWQALLEAETAEFAKMSTASAA